MDNQTLAIIALIVYLLVGIVFCFFGNRWLKIIVGVYGFILGFVVANALLPMFTSFGNLEIMLLSIGAGLVGALLFVLFLYAGIFFIGFGAGILLCLLIVDAFSLNIYTWYIYIPVLIVASILGSLTLNKRRIFISIFTAYIGASALGVFVYSLVNGIKLQTLISFDNPKAMSGVYNSTIYLVSLAVLFVVGLVVQLAVTSRKQIR